MIIGVFLILTGIVILILNMKGTHVIWYLFGVVPIPLDFWMPIVMVIAGVSLLIQHA